MKKPTVAQVTAVLELLARFHPAGMGVLLGQAQPPSALEIAELLESFSGANGLGVRIAGGVRTPEAERKILLAETVTGIIEAIGGWEHICDMVRDARRALDPERWREAADFAAHITPGGYMRDGSGGIGARLYRTDGMGLHEICERTARRRFRNILRMIAAKILSSPPETDFALISSLSGGYPS